MTVVKLGSHKCAFHFIYGQFWILWNTAISKISQESILKSIYKLTIQIFKKNLYDLLLIVVIQSYHNFEHVSTTELSWRMQNSDMIVP